MSQSGFGWTRVISDSVITQGKCVVAGLIINASTDAGDVSLYDGLDTLSGRLFDTFQGLANESKVISFPAQIHFDSGLLIDIGSNITSVTVIWLPLPKDN